MEPPPECRQETPALTEAAAEFLSLIGPEELERCLFAETLEVVAAGGQPRDQAGGQWWVAARWAPYERAGEPVRSCLLVQAGSRGRHDSVAGSSTLKAYVTPQLETLEQEEQECPELRAHPIERRTHMVSHQHGMTVTKTLREGEEKPQCWSFSYGRAELRGLLLEGASLLLLRVLACRRAVPPGLVFPAIDTEGHLCTSSYRALGIQRQAVGSAEAEVFVIERAMHASTGVSTVWHSSFLPSGYGRGSGRGHPSPASLAGTQEGVTGSSPRRRLARLVQVGCPMLVLLQDESVLGKTGGVEPRPPFPKQPLDWEEDIQLCSWFLDRKEDLQASHAAYVRQHPELRALLADFLQALLLQQPCDPVSFAAKFFARQQHPGTPFASAGAASPPPHHRLANGE
ncbi:LOW QUALITY PROTEIN: ciliogenesis-associated TTC17-interacting protein [Gymnogyps californianus]|uniref:LOW QUALITY PROTEIN: ciliogenesis-associated TTC17-interacting protein n=1 Tax=Gymnogyps californianus TaxID=33616 RepID=UPI0021C642BE|nr:LOW QUALITY PROTEIN: ciliogenesis-associated TTC17-interacting protein [Gymnogyps californianus]